MRSVQWTPWGAAVLAMAILAGPAFAQDSVSNQPPINIVGDALDPWQVGPPTYQCRPYVVDLAPFQASWGTEFGIAPLIKSSKGNVGGLPFFNSLISAQTISRVQARGVSAYAPQYAAWVGAPGTGVHPVNNNPPQTIAPPDRTNQFGVAFADFGTAEGADYNGIVGGLVNYDPAEPTRLYVTRIMAAVNGAAPGQNLSQFGIGAIDEQGNLLYRADQGTGSNSNVIHTDLQSRACDMRNVVDLAGGTGPSDASHWIVQNSPTVHVVPNVGPEAVFGPNNPYLLESNFDGNYVRGPVTGPTVTNADWLASQSRGAVAYMTKNHPCLPGATNGVAAILDRIVGPGTDTIRLFGLAPGANNAADVASVLPLTMPAAVSIVDPITGGFTPPINGVLGTDFGYYSSQTAFRGGTGQIALNIDQAGRLLAAAGIHYNNHNTKNDPFNGIVAARVAPDTCETAWSLVAYSVGYDGANFDDTQGKPILDGPGGSIIGRMCPLYLVTGGSPAGPSISAPMIDSVGNVWFIAAVALFKTDQQGQPFTDYDSALIRAVYDPARFGWELELIFELGSTFVGQNSGLPWQISFISLADVGSDPSVDSATAWSQNISEKAHLGVDAPTGLPTQDPKSLGGIVIAADITYDQDGDGFFNDPSSSFYDPTKPADEAYQVLLYIGAREPGQGDTTPPEIVGSWYSWKNHGAALGDLGLEIPQAPPDRAPIETREGSVTTLTFTFSEAIDPATFDTTKISICGQVNTPPAPATATLDAGGTQATLTWAAGAIPNGYNQASQHDHYAVVVANTVTDLAGNPLAGDRDVDFAASFGNVRTDGVLANWANVNANDRSRLVDNYTPTPTAAQAVIYDIRITGPANIGKVNANDRSWLTDSYSAVGLVQAAPTCP